jgi:succinate dehydrogenase / fumarate reductase iron-sulfur subunit
MVRQMDKEGFGNSTVTGSCGAVCPKEVSLSSIARRNRVYGAADLKGWLPGAPLQIGKCPLSG